MIPALSIVLSNVYALILICTKLHWSIMVFAQYFKTIWLFENSNFCCKFKALDDLSVRELDGMINLSKRMAGEPFEPIYFSTNIFIYILQKNHIIWLTKGTETETKRRWKRKKRSTVAHSLWNVPFFWWNRDIYLLSYRFTYTETRVGFWWKVEMIHQIEHMFDKTSDLEKKTAEHWYGRQI